MADAVVRVIIGAVDNFTAPMEKLIAPLNTFADTIFGLQGKVEQFFNGSIFKLASLGGEFAEQKSQVDALSVAYGKNGDALMRMIDDIGSGAVKVSSQMTIAGRAMAAGLGSDEIRTALTYTKRSTELLNKSFEDTAELVLKAFASGKFDRIGKEIGLVIEKGDTASSVLKKMSIGISAFGDGAFNTADSIGKITAKVDEWVTRVGDAINSSESWQAAIQYVADTVGNFVQTFDYRPITTFFEAAIRFGGILYDAFTETFGGIGTLIRDTFNNAGTSSGAKELFTALGKAGIELTRTLAPAFQMIADAVPTVIQGFGFLVEQAGAAFQGIQAGAANVGLFLVESFGRAIQEVVQLMLEASANNPILSQAFGDAPLNALAGLTKGIRETRDAFQSWSDTALEKNSFETLGQQMQGFSSKITINVEEPLKKLADNFEKGLFDFKAPEPKLPSPEQIEKQRAAGKALMDIRAAAELAAMNERQEKVDKKNEAAAKKAATAAYEIAKAGNDEAKKALDEWEKMQSDAIKREEYLDKQRFEKKKEAIDAQAKLDDAANKQRAAADDEEYSRKKDAYDREKQLAEDALDARIEQARTALDVRLSALDAESSAVEEALRQEASAQSEYFRQKNREMEDSLALAEEAFRKERAAAAESFDNRRGALSAEERLAMDARTKADAAAEESARKRRIDLKAEIDAKLEKAQLDEATARAEAEKARKFAEAEAEFEKKAHAQRLTDISAEYDAKRKSAKKEYDQTDTTGMPAADKQALKAKLAALQESYDAEEQARKDAENATYESYQSTLKASLERFDAEEKARIESAKRITEELKKAEEARLAAFDEAERQKAAARKEEADALKKSFADRMAAIDAEQKAYEQQQAAKEEAAKKAGAAQKRALEDEQRAADAALANKSREADKAFDARKKQIEDERKQLDASADADKRNLQEQFRLRQEAIEAEAKAKKTAREKDEAADKAASDARKAALEKEIDRREALRKSQEEADKSFAKLREQSLDAEAKRFKQIKENLGGTAGPNGKLTVDHKMPDKQTYSVKVEGVSWPQALQELVSEIISKIVQQVRSDRLPLVVTTVGATP